jgi:hypothetical protein
MNALNRQTWPACFLFLGFISADPFGELLAGAFRCGRILQYCAIRGLLVA